MSPSINASWSEAESSLDFVAFRAVPTTLYPRARNTRTIPAPMPCDAPVTITVLGGLFIVTLITSAVSDSAGCSRRDLLDEPRVAVGIVKGEERPVAGALRIGAGLPRLARERGHVAHVT